MPGAILIIDDNADDANLIKMAVLSLGPKSPVLTVASSKELREYLEGQGCYADRQAFPYPALVLLDLRMPEEGGLEVLLPGIPAVPCCWRPLELEIWAPGSTLPF